MKLQDPTDRSGRGRQDRDTTKKITILKEGTWNGASDIARSYSGSGRGREDGCHQKHCATAIKVGGGYNRFPSIFRALPNSIFEKCNEVRRRKRFARQNMFFFLRCANGDSDELNWATRMSIFPQRHVPSKGWVPKKCGSSRSYFVGSKLCPYNRYKYGCYWAPIKWRKNTPWTQSSVPLKTGLLNPKGKDFIVSVSHPFARAKKIWVSVEFFPLQDVPRDDHFWTGVNLKTGRLLVLFTPFTPKYVTSSKWG